MPRVFVLIPAHNNKNEVMGILDCLKQQSYEEFRVILVDDGSIDGTEDEVKRFFPEVTLLKGNGKLWWTGAICKGVNFVEKIAKNRDFILLLNNDVTIQKDYVEKLVEASLENGRAVVGSTIVDCSNPANLTAGMWMDRNLRIEVNRDSNVTHRTKIDKEVDVLSGRGTLVPIEIFQKIGTFNKRKLPHYGADNEFFIRAKRAGFQLISSHLARVYADLSITGINIPEEEVISFREGFALLFSKRSKANIFYFINYVWLCSEKDFRLKNSIKSGISIIIQVFRRTIIGYPIYYSWRFLFKSFDFTWHDLKSFELDGEQLLRKGIIKRRRLRHQIYFYFAPKRFVKKEINEMKIDERKKIKALVNQTFRLAHKLKIVRNKFNVLVFKESR